MSMLDNESNINGSGSGVSRNYNAQCEPEILTPGLSIPHSMIPPLSIPRGQMRKHLGPPFQNLQSGLESACL